MIKVYVPWKWCLYKRLNAVLFNKNGLGQNLSIQVYLNSIENFLCSKLYQTLLLSLAITERKVPELHLWRTLKRISQKKERPIILFGDVNDDDDDNNNILKTKVTPVIKGAPGMYSKSFRTYLSNITGKHEIKETQK